jgi:hypothetical protein
MTYEPFAVKLKRVSVLVADIFVADYLRIGGFRVNSTTKKS